MEHTRECASFFYCHFFATEKYSSLLSFIENAFSSETYKKKSISYYSGMSEGLNIWGGGSSNVEGIIFSP